MTPDPATLLASVRQQLVDFYSGTNWVADNLADRLARLSADQALAHPAGHSHSIAGQVAHLIAWRGFVTQHLQGNGAFDIEMDTTADWPEVHDWQALQASLAHSQEVLLRAIDSFDPARWHEKTGNRDYTYGFLLQGTIHHDYYHYGHIGAALAALRRQEVRSDEGMG